MRTAILAICSLTWGGGVGTAQLEAQWSGVGATAGALEARVWLDRGIDPVLYRGEEVRVYYRASRDAYVALLHIDTNGLVRLISPSGPGESLRVREGLDYRVRFGSSDDWVVSDPPGVGYFFLLASPTPFDFTAFGYSPITGGWDLSMVGNRATRDPFLVAESFLERLLPEWVDREFALDFSAYHVGQVYSYPRFLCYDCHANEPLDDWNPYFQACPEVRVVIYNDPYFYPVTRYRGTRVVYSRPGEPGRSQFDLRERAPGEPGRPLVQSRTADGGEGAVGAPPPQRGAAELGLGWGDELRSLPDLLRRVAPSPVVQPRPVLERRAPRTPPGGDTIPMNR